MTAGLAVALAPLLTACPGLGGYPTYALGDVEPYLVTTADLNGDGAPDVITADGAGTRQPAGLSVLLGKGDGTLGKARHLAVGGVPVDVAAIDVNGDGVTDLVAAYGGAPGVTGVAGVSVLLGAGDGSFGPHRDVALQGTLEASYRPQDELVAADLNGDGFGDAIVVTWSTPTGTGGTSSTSLTVLLGASDGTLHPAGTLPFAGSSVGVLVAGDLNGDGVPDLVLTTASSSLPETLEVWLGNGDGTFTAGPTYATSSPASGPGFVTASAVLADVNGDGALDLATTSGSSVNVRLGAGDGTFGAATAFATAPGPFELVAADVDGDGSLDLVTDDFAIDAGAVLTGLSVLRGHGDGTFEAPIERSTRVGLRWLAAADLNGDGASELVTIGWGPPGSVTVLPGL